MIVLKSSDHSQIKNCNHKITIYIEYIVMTNIYRIYSYDKYI